MSLILNLLYPQIQLDVASFKPYGPKTLPGFDSTLPLFHYHPPLSDYLHSIKYGFQTSLIPPLSSYLSNQIQTNYPHLLNYWQKNVFTILPVPLFWGRQNWRGFNQSQLFAQIISQNLGLSCQPDWLKRSKYQTPQVKLANSSRQTNLSTAFAINPSCLPSISASSGNFILFDDVITTGSTLSACLRPLLPYQKLLPWGLSIAG